MFSRLPRLALVLSLTGLLSCALADSGPASHRGALEEGSPEALGLIAFLNQTSVAELDVEVALDRRAADNLIAFRAGLDQQLGSADDREFLTLAEVDAVPRVGPATLNRLLEYVLAGGWVVDDDDPMGSFEGVSFTYAQAELVLDLVNSASSETLGTEVGLVSQARSSILAGRPVADMETLAALYYVGPAALTRLRDFVSPAPIAELGIISDLDKTVIPPASSGLPEASYPGVAALYTELEFGDTGSAGDLHYVTAREADAVLEIPDWLELQGIPQGSIDTGVSGLPWVARPEKVEDISGVFDANPEQRYVLIGDTSHVDPDAYRDIIAKYPGRVRAAFVHHVKNISDARAEGLHVFENYAEVAAILLSLEILDEAAARAVMESARAEGLAITEAEIDSLIATHLP